MRKSLAIFAAILLLSGCRESDVTSSSQYNFSLFSGTEWKTKVKVAVAEIKQGGAGELCLIAPDSFDTTDAHYRPIAGCTVMSVLPVGSRIRIGHLMQNNGDWGGVRVTATVEDSPFSERTVYVERELLAKNTFIWNGWSSSTNWDVNTNILERP
jgi:hypothetical protein